MEGDEELSVICIKVVVEKGNRRVLRGVVYMMKSKGPRTPQEAECKEDRWLSHLTWKDRDDR